MAELTFTASQVARLAGLNIETLRVWRRRGYFGDMHSEGWTRYTWPDLFTIALFADIVNSTGSHDHARAVAKIGRAEMFRAILGHEDESGLPYVIAANHPETGELIEVVIGITALGASLQRHILSDAHFGQYSVIDLGKILHRLFTRLKEESPSKETTELVQKTIKLAQSKQSIPNDTDGV
jgi:hypothetical protein